MRKQLEKLKTNPDDQEEEIIVEEAEQKEEKCKYCGKGYVHTLDLNVKFLKTCNLCGHRETIKK